jgi:DedD protein
MARPISEQELQLKKRARRRLVGAIVLVTAVAVVLPMVLDSEPKPVSSNVEINIPSPDSGDFKPKGAAPGPGSTARGETAEQNTEAASAPTDSPPATSAAPQAPAKPAVTESSSVIVPRMDGQGIPSLPSGERKQASSPQALAEAPKPPPAVSEQPTAAPAPEKSKPAPVTDKSKTTAAANDVKPQPTNENTNEQASATAKASAENPKPKGPTENAKAKAPTEHAKAAAPAESPRHAAEPAKAPGAYVVQVAALSDAAKAKQLQKQMSGVGVETYTEVVSTKTGDVTRVRAGPFATREAAEKARAQLKKAGLDGHVVPK